MTDSAQILIDELDALNSKIDQIKLDAVKVEQAAKNGGVQGARAIEDQIRTLQESSKRYQSAGAKLYDVIQHELIPAAKEQKRKPLKFALWILFLCFIFVSGFAFAQFMTIPKFGPFLAKSQYICELAEGNYTVKEDGDAYCIFWNFKLKN